MPKGNWFWLIPFRRSSVSINCDMSGHPAEWWPDNVHFSSDNNIHHWDSQIEFIFHLQALDQAKRYEGLSNQCKAVSGPGDLGNFMRVLPLPPITNRVPRKAFAPPAGADSDEAPDFNVIIIMAPLVCTAVEWRRKGKVVDKLLTCPFYTCYRTSSLSTGVHRFKCDPH